MPDHLGRLIAALTEDETDFYVHVDRKVPVEPFLAHSATNVHFLERRLPVYWGQWQMVEATLRLIRSAIGQADYDYLVLLSGSCYPIRSRVEIRGMLAAQPGAQYINSVAMPNAAVGKSLARLDRFYRRSDQSLLENVWRAAIGTRTLRRSGWPLSRRWLLARDWRRGLGSLAPYGGSTWWALTGDACRHVDAFVERERRATRFLENTRSPDEVLFQTILGNSPFAPMVHPSLTFTDWSAGGRHPAEITERHLARFAEPGPLLSAGPYGRGDRCFARKFPDDGGRMTRLVDEIVRQRVVPAA